MLRFIRLLATAAVTSMVLVVLLVVAINGLPTSFEDSRWSAGAYKHMGRTTLSRPALSKSFERSLHSLSPINHHSQQVVNPKAVSYEVAQYNLESELESINIDVTKGNLFYSSDLKTFGPTILEEFDRWESSTQPKSTKSVNYDYLVVKQIFTDQYHSVKSYVISEWYRPSIFRIFADMKVLREKADLNIDDSPFHDIPRTKIMLDRIIMVLESIAENQTNRMYDVTLAIFQRLLDVHVSAGDDMVYMSCFIQEMLMGGVPLPDGSIKVLAQGLINRWQSSAHVPVEGATAVVNHPDPAINFDPKKQFLEVVYDQSLERFLEYSRQTIDERLRTIKKELASKQ